MTSIHRRPAGVVLASALAFAVTMISAAAQQGPPAPTGPMAPEKYKNIQVLTDVPADQLDVTMRYFVSATGIQCIQCHVQDAATGEWQYDKDDKNGKKTARKMIAMVKAINAGADNYGLNGVNCGTCHAGNNQPRGLQPAGMMTADQISAFNLQQATMAARQGGAGRAGAPPAGGAPPGGGAAGGGRGQQAPLPPIDDAINKYIEGLGGRAAIEQLQAVTITGTLMTREARAIPFAIDEKGNKYRESIQTAPDATTRAFDGTAGWQQSGTRAIDLTGFPLEQLQRNADLTLSVKFKEKYPGVTAGRPTQLQMPSGARVDVNILTSGPATPANDYTTIQWAFDASSGLLLRKTVRTTTALRGALTETWDYSDYRAVGGVKMPYMIMHTNWNSFDTFRVSTMIANPSIDDARFAKPKG